MKHRILFLLMLLCTFYATAQTKKVQNETKEVDILGNTCKETTSFYYDDEDNKILHGKYILKCATQWAKGNESYKFITNEDANYTDGSLNGAYTYSHILDKKSQVKFQTNTYPWYKILTAIDKANDKTTGSYKMGKADGKWSISYTKKSSIGNETTQDTKGNISFLMDNGHITSITLSNGEKYSIRYHIDTLSGDTICLVSGKCGKYNIHNGIIVSHFIRLNNDISPIEDAELATEIKSINNPLDYYSPLLEKGFIIVPIRDYMQDEISDFPNTGFLKDYFYAIGDKGYTMYRQANFFSTTYYILHRVKLLPIEDGKKIVDQLIENYYYRDLDTIIYTQRNPLNHQNTEYFSKATTEQLTTYIDERMTVIRQEEERRIAEEKRKEEERIAEEKRKEEERIAEEKRYEEYKKNTEDINSYYDHYGTMLFTNFPKEMRYVPREGFKANGTYMHAAQTYWNIAYSELKILNHLDSKRHDQTTADDYTATKKIVSFYFLFYNYCCEAPMVDSLERLAKQIKTESKNVKDIYKAYQPIYSNIKISKLFENQSELLKYAQEIYDHIKLQKQCLDFIAVRNEIAKQDEAILDSKAKYIRKLYSAYYEAADKTWDPNANIDKLTSILEIQKKVLSIVQRDDIKDFDSKVKKTKIATLDEVLTMSE